MELGSSSVIDLCLVVELLVDRLTDVLGKPKLSPDNSLTSSSSYLASSSDSSSEQVSLRKFIGRSTYLSVSSSGYTDDLRLPPTLDFPDETR